MGHLPEIDLPQGLLNTVQRNIEPTQRADNPSWSVSRVGLIRSGHQVLQTVLAKLVNAMMDRDKLQAALQTDSTNVLRRDGWRRVWIP